MKKPFSIRPSLIAVAVAGALLGAPQAYAEESNLSDLFAKHAALLGNLGRAVAAAGQGGNSDATPALDAGSLQRKGLQMGALKPSSLETSRLSGAPEINTQGVGLTPAEQWRALFPEKKRQ